MLQTVDGSPFGVVARHEPVQRATKSDLVRRVRSLELEALAAEPAPRSARACLQDFRHLTTPTLRVYDRLARRGTAVTLLARGLVAWLPHGLRGVELAESDPLGDQWVVLVLSERSFCLSARDLPTEDCADPERSFEWALTRRPELVAEVDLLLDRA